VTTKIHAVVDAHGNPVALSVTPGQAADLTQGGPLLERLRPEAVLADRGYDSDKLVAALEAREVMPVIALKANRKEQRARDFARDRERNLGARCFNTIKHFEAIAIRFVRVLQAITERSVDR
jgi:transposase